MDTVSGLKIGDIVSLHIENYAGTIFTKIVTVARVIPCDDTKDNIWTSDNRVHFSTECELLDGKSSGYSPDFTIIDDIEYGNYDENPYVPLYIIERMKL